MNESNSNYRSRKMDEEVSDNSDILYEVKYSFRIIGITESSGSARKKTVNGFTPCPQHDPVVQIPGKAFKASQIGMHSLSI